MTQEWTVPAWLALVAAAALVLPVLLTLVTSRRQRADAVRLQARLAELESRLAEPAPAPSAPGQPAVREASEFVITRLGDQPAAPTPVPAPVVPAAVFADIVLRESVVTSASLLHGLRRALAPEVRHRIRFEVRREVKRARKARRVEQREARRAWQSRQRPGDTAGDAA